MSNTIKFLGVDSSLVDLTERKDSVNNSKTEYFSIEEIKGYKAFSCLLTQDENPSEEELVQDPLTIGVTYKIANDTEGVVGDFTNVGAPNNEDGTYFIATGEEPNSWGDSVLEWNTGAPVVQVLENDLGHVWFEFKDMGSFTISSNNSIFTNGKTAFIDSTSYQPGIGIVAISSVDLGDVGIGFTTSLLDSIEQKLVERPTFVEIRVYN